MFLIFLPGVEENPPHANSPRAARAGAQRRAPPASRLAHTEDQDRALRPSDQQKIILAYEHRRDIADDRRRAHVIDRASRASQASIRSEVSSSRHSRISRASATSAAGRAGRTAPGQCIRLWSAAEDRNLEDFESPEIKRIDLTPTFSRLHAWAKAIRGNSAGYEPPTNALSRPPSDCWKCSAPSNERDGRQITDIGKRLLALPVHPRIGRLLLAAADQGLSREGASLAALLLRKDILRRSEDQRPSTQGPSDL
jgi:ATP-dependent helicase HrpB